MKAKRGAQPDTRAAVNMSMHEYYNEPIYAYTRKQAIEDGILVDVSSLYPSDTRLYKFPVAITSEIWDLIEGSMEAIWVWDICYMTTKFPIAKPDESTVIAECHLPDAPGSKNVKSYFLKAKCHSGDDLEPVITIGFAPHNLDRYGNP